MFKYKQLDMISSHSKIEVNPKCDQAYDLFHTGILHLAKAERQGIRLDVEYAEDKRKQITNQINELEHKLYETKFYRHWEHVSKSKPNINSDAQLRYFLYNVKKLSPPHRTTSGLGAVDEDALNQFNIPELNDILRIRKLKKVRDTYLGGFIREEVDGCIHPFYNLHIARTYRSSSDSPNFQNIPKRDEESMQICRAALKARPGHQLLEVDYSGLEVRIAACYHEDSTMIKYIKDPKSDMHADMAERIFELEIDRRIPGHNTLRQAVKNGFVFPQFYGDYYGNCATNIAQKWCKLPLGRWRDGEGTKVNGEHLSTHLRQRGIKSFKQFTEHIKEIEYDFWNNTFKEYQAWKERWWKGYQKNGYIDMKTGFRCGGVMSRNDTINYPIQGSAFHCLLWSFNEISRIMYNDDFDTKPVGQIHDSILLDVNPNELEQVADIVRRVTCQDLPKAWDWIVVPLDIDAEISPVDGSWAEKEDYDL